jgi:hypothetical protein
MDSNINVPISPAQLMAMSTMVPSTPTSVTLAHSAPPVPPPRNAPTIPTRRVLVQHDFNGESAQELDLRKGDIIVVIEEIDEGWWIGEKGM